MELDFSVDTETGETKIGSSRPQQGRSGVVRASIDALDKVEYSKMNRIIEQEYRKKQKSIMDKPLGDVISNTVNFFGSSLDSYSEKLMEASFTNKIYESDNEVLNTIQLHLIAISLFIRDDENVIYLGIIMIILSFLICLINITRGYEYKLIEEPTKS